MRPVIGFHQTINADMCVFLCGGKTFVPQQFLYNPQICAGIQHMRRKRVPKRVAASVFGYPEFANSCANRFLDTGWIQVMSPVMPGSMGIHPV